MTSMVCKIVVIVNVRVVFVLTAGFRLPHLAREMVIFGAIGLCDNCQKLNSI